MPNMLQRGLTWVASKLQDVAGRTVTYQRGNQTVSIIGVPKMLDYVVDDDDGIPRLVTFYDWIFTTAEMLLGTQPIVPRPGDRIVETLNGEELTYEAMGPATRPISEWTDSTGTMRTVHTKLVKRA